MEHMELIVSAWSSHIKGTVALISFWFFGAFLAKKIEENFIVGVQANSQIHAVRNIARGVKYFCIFLGIIILLKHVGVEIQGAITGLGFTGVSLGIAFKDSIANLVGGIFIVIYKPFRLGDYIIITTDKMVLEGTVKEIDFRYTILQSDKGPMHIPNYIVYMNVITIKK